MDKAKMYFGLLAVIEQTIETGDYSLLTEQAVSTDDALQGMAALSAAVRESYKPS